MQSLRHLLNRDPLTHKFDYGHILLVGGSTGKTGAICLSTLAALRAGAGVVTTAVPETLNPIIEVKLTEAMSLPLDSRLGMIFGNAFETVEQFCRSRKVTVMGIGPGMGVGDGPRELVRRVLGELDLPLVLDADALNVCAEDISMLDGMRSRPCVLTPHAGEFSRLIGVSVADVLKTTKTLAQEFALRYNLVLVVKGHRTLITDGKMIFENDSGNPGMATAGSGDVLTGVICALMGQGLDAFDAAQAGVFLHGLAGDIAADEKTQPGMIASDIVECLPLAWNKICPGSSIGRATDL
jgi:hydroxyethylthiazole kinase-like uncharacterized protein yjeF